MTKKAKLITKITAASVLTVLSVGLGVGTSIAYNYESLLDVTFTMGSYEASTDAKQLCQDVAAEGLVLLKNEDDALPLAADETKVALLGQNSVDFVYGGSGSGAIDTSLALNLKQSFEEAGFTVNQTVWDFYASGAGSSYRKKTPDTSGKGSFEVNEVPASAFTNDFKNSLTDDVGVVVFGRSGGESADLPLSALPTGSLYLQLDQNERDTLALACSKFSKVVLLMNTNNPVELDVLEDPAYANVKACVWIGGVGQEGIRAIPKVLSGDVNPSGRLVDTYAYDSTSAPSFPNMAGGKIANSTVTNGTNYMVFGEGIYVGYRYYETRYEDVVLGSGDDFDYASEVQFPFGYGLSYTTFEWSDFKVAKVEDRYDVSVTVTNTGDMAGKDVVEIYVQKPYTSGSFEVASVELIDFAKTMSLEPGASQTVTVNIDAKDLVSYDHLVNKTYVLNEGDFYFAAGRNAHDGLNNILAAKGKGVSDGMTEAGDASLSSKFLTVDALDATTYAKSAATGENIGNALGESDIKWYDDSYVYLSRANWKGTFPTHYQNGSWTAPAGLLSDLEFYDISKDTSDDDVIASFTFRTDSQTTSYKVGDLINVDVNDPRWDDLVAQLSWSQMTKLIRMGGYATLRIDRIGLPATQDKDGPSGISASLVGGVSCMAWPAEVVMASTWNKLLIEQLGVLFGEDSIKAGVAGVYGPGANIHRSPYSGRNFEYFSEDPRLSYEMAAYENAGLRSKGVITYIKHFALNDQETNRYGAAIFANEQAIREIFLKGFEGGIVEGKSNALMVAMNRVGSRWAGANKGLMTQILRKEWGFQGMAITDQASVKSMGYQDMISGMWAGTNLWLNTDQSLWSLAEYKDNANVCYYIHQSAKAICQSITDSWAVNEAYKTNASGGSIGTNVTIFPWRQTIWAMDIVCWVGTGVMLTFLVLGILKYRKEDKASPEA